LPLSGSPARNGSPEIEKSGNTVENHSEKPSQICFVLLNYYKRISMFFFVYNLVIYLL